MLLSTLVSNELYSVRVYDAYLSNTLSLIDKSFYGKKLLLWRRVATRLKLGLAELGKSLKKWFNVQSLKSIVRTSFYAGYM